MRRGSVFWVNLEPASPPELGKVRPAVVVSNSVHNERLDSVVVVPLSAQPPEIWPFRVRVDVAGLKASFAVVPGIRQAHKGRLHELAGYVGREDLRRLDEALRVYLGE